MKPTKNRTLKRIRKQDERYKEKQINTKKAEKRDKD